MALIHAFRPWRYHASAGKLADLATQPYDTIPAELEATYRARSRYNLVQLILPGADYAGAALRLRQWVDDGILFREEEPALFVYEQRFRMPESGEALVRRSFIGLGEPEGVRPHERTLDPPKFDRLELLRHTKAQFGSIFMAYPDTAGTVELLLNSITGAPPLESFLDDQQTSHSLWRVSDAAWIRAVQEAMRDKLLLIVDGHHRYEAALQYARERPACEGAQRVMMTFVNLHSPALRTLAAHRTVTGVADEAIEQLASTATPLDSAEALAAAWAATPPGRVRFGLVLPGSLRLIEVARPEGALNLTVLHEEILHRRLRITPEAVARQQFVRYRRGIDVAARDVESGVAQAAFLVEPLPVAEVARLAFEGKTLPQKSTDFYPKLASGLTIFGLDD